MAPLIAFSPGKKLIIKKVHSGRNFQKRLESMGLGINKVIELIKGPPGPVIVKVENSKIALGFGEASKIYVEEV